MSQHLEQYQFKRGNPGGPGRPKGLTPFGDTVRELMKAKEISVTWTVNGKTKELKVTSDKNMHYGVTAALILEALKGNVLAAREIITRCEGRPAEVIEATVDHQHVHAHIDLTNTPRRDLERLRDIIAAATSGSDTDTERG